MNLGWSVEVEFNAALDTVKVISEAVFTANHLTDTDKGEPMDFKFGTLAYHSTSHPADEKSSLKGPRSRSCDP